MIFHTSLEAELGTTRKTITVTDQQDEWIKAQIEGGGFTNDSEYIRDLIRRDQARNSAIEAIRGELIKGEQSGEPQPFDGDRFKAEMAARHASKGR
jgi:antitoxin ParD1/3/4